MLKLAFSFYVPFWVNILYPSPGIHGSCKRNSCIGVIQASTEKETKIGVMWTFTWWSSMFLINVNSSLFYLFFIALIE